MTAKELANKLNGHEYRNEFPIKLIKEVKDSGLVIVYGYSDDLMEIEGAIEGEGDCYGGREFKIDAEGLIPSKDDMEDEEDDDALEIWVMRRKNSKKIKAVWCAGKNKEGWSYETTIPHEKFKILETEHEVRDVQCIGIVFSIEDLK